MLETSRDVNTVFRRVPRLWPKSHCATFEITEYGPLSTISADLLVGIATNAKNPLPHVLGRDEVSM
ncbi:hypothetical protein D3C73_1513590 [compost metagenome]